MLGGLVQAYCEKGESFDSPFFFIYEVSYLEFIVIN
nr:MAG TPA: hypothetical protein [Caudoviricetes sp.]